MTLPSTARDMASVGDALTRKWHDLSAPTPDTSIIRHVPTCLPCDVVVLSLDPHLSRNLLLLLSLASQRAASPYPTFGSQSDFSKRTYLMNSVLFLFWTGARSRSDRYNCIETNRCFEYNIACFCYTWRSILRGGHDVKNTDGSNRISSRTCIVSGISYTINIAVCDTCSLDESPTRFLPIFLSTFPPAVRHRLCLLVYCEGDDHKRYL